jgi:photosystem II stability/assembly factor-like uncharacterized protein
VTKGIALASAAIIAAVASYSTEGGVPNSQAQPRAPATRSSNFITAVAFVRDDPRKIWVLLNDGPALYRSDDAAKTWHRIGGLPERQVMGVLALDRSGQNVYLAARYDPLLWHSADGGATWSRVATWPRQIAPIGSHRLRPAVVAALKVDPQRSATIYAVAENVVLRTDDGGRTWRRASHGLARGLPNYPWYGGDLVLDPLHPDGLYFATGRRGVYRSLDGGGHWARLSQKCVRVRDCIAKAYGYGSYVVLGVDPTRPRRVYAGLPYAIYQSSDGGDRWRRVLSLNRGFGGDLVVASDGTVYANGSRRASLYVARSDDGGAHWRLTLGFHSPYKDTAFLAPDSLAVDPTNPDVVIAAVGAANNGGASLCVRLLKTTNRGARWDPIDTGLVDDAHRCRTTR